MPHAIEVAGVATARVGGSIHVLLFIYDVKVAGIPGNKFIFLFSNLVVTIFFTVKLPMLNC